MFDRDEYLTFSRRIQDAERRTSFAEAMDEFSDILTDLPPIYLGRALFCRGRMKRNHGFIAEAKRDWLDALDYLQEYSFLRYQIETALGEVEETGGETVDAIEWYRRAITTCSEAGDFVGHQALDRYLDLNNGILLTEDVPIVSSALRSSWQTLEAPGALDFADLPGSIQRLRDSFGRKVEEAKYRP